MKCGKCDAINSDTAKFCAKCAFRLSGPTGRASGPRKVAAQVTLAPPSEVTQPAIATPATIDPATVPQAVPLSLSVEQSNAPPNRLTPTGDRRNRNAYAIGGGLVIVLASVAWFGRSALPPAVGTAAVSASQSIPATTAPVVATASVPKAAEAPLKSPEIVPPMITEYATPPNPEGTPDKKKKSVAKAEKQKSTNQPESLRATDSETIRKQEEASALQSEQARNRELQARLHQEELARQVKGNNTQYRSPQQVCANQTNFFTRGICESRECERPERARVPFCVEMRERRAAKNLGG